MVLTTQIQRRYCAYTTLFNYDSDVTLEQLSLLSYLTVHCPSATPDWSDRLFRPFLSHLDTVPALSNSKMIMDGWVTIGAQILNVMLTRHFSRQLGDIHPSMARMRQETRQDVDIRYYVANALRDPVTM